MIRYSLTCDRKHSFESWFANSDAFERQIELGLVECPVCASTSVTKSLMAPAVKAGNGKPPSLSAPSSPAEAALRAMREKIETESDYVGKEFAAEARRIHLGEADARGIWGEASHDDAKALKEEGVPVAPIPFMRRRDD